MKRQTMMPSMLKPPFVRSMLSMLSPGGAAARLSVMLFHKIPTVADPLATDEIDLKRFEQILDFVGANANVLPLAEASDALRRGKLPPRAVALTFDDGYAEWIHNVSPALRRRGLPATFFVTTGHLNGAEALWHERIIAAVRSLPASGARLPAGIEAPIDLDQTGNRQRLVTQLQERLKYAPLRERLDAIQQLENQACRPLILPPGFDADSVRMLHSQGFEIGAHTTHHPILNECTPQQAFVEIAGCKEELEAIIRAPVLSFAYPNGRPGKDFSAEHVDMVKTAGYRHAVTTSSGVARIDTDPLQLPRFTPWGLSDERITFQLARNMFVRPAQLAAAPRDKNPQTEVRCLMVASTFTPIHGGSAVVYENLCRGMPRGSIRVLTAHTSYQNGESIPNWQEHDARQEFPIDRIALLRPKNMKPPANKLVSVWRLIAQDLPLYVRILFKAGQLVRRHRINIICIGELVTGTWLGLVLKRLFGVKLITYVHGEEITTATSGYFGTRRKQLLQAADKVIAVSSFTCDAMAQQMDLAPSAMVLIQNGVDLSRFTPGPRDTDLIARHSLSGKQVILTVGRLVARKGVDMTVRAMKLVVARRPNVHYLIVGDGEMRDEIAKIIVDEGLSEWITMVGKVSDDELLRYLRLCDLFVMPNRTMPDGDTEGFGLVFREANACHKPVIGGRAGGAVEAVSDGVSGLLVDGYQPEAIAAAIERILGDPVFAARLADGGIALAREHSTQAVARKFLETCELLLTNKVA
jgi:glycosyltransferase involved in cell wall biosynthesis/peptidoglycan/xylan/chitin deacetylase (PgdA/CDA1 family)